MKLNEDGTAEIEFERADGTTFTVKIKRPKIGQFKRLRVEAQNALKASQDALTEWGEQTRARKERIDAGEAPDAVPEVRAYSEVLTENDERMADSAFAWWNLVLVGDDTFRALGDKPADVQALSTDDWPSYLIYGAEAQRTSDGLATRTGTAFVLLQHWQSAPLDRGVKQLALN